MKADVVVIGGGHAGIEAVHSAAKYGLSVILITANLDFIGQMSCNPSIGGIAKGIIVREIDALGGLMGKIIDQAGIQFRMLNKSKGMAVWGNRAQADKDMYRYLCRSYLEKLDNVSIYQDMVTHLESANNTVTAVRTISGRIIEANSVVLAMGTFLNGLAHVGMSSFSCGRSGELASLKLSESIQAFGINAGRLKTGTSARIDGTTIDYSKLEEQKGDTDPWAFSYSTRESISNKVVCWETRTNKKTHEIIKNNIEDSPLYSGKIKAIGPRYCPSIEDKVIRFGDRNGHTLFLEPEGLKSSEMYLNGFSTSLPISIQENMVQSLPGFNHARITRPGYAIEYDYFYPEQLYNTLESRKVKNLFFAGQINGTSGYEEAAAQGLMAGVNAARKVLKKKSLILGRENSYIGVLIDDLVTKGTEEPYRMFTSRAEYRLLLRQDNADERLMKIARDYDIIESSLYNERKRKWEEKKEIMNRMKIMKISPEQWNKNNDDNEISKKVSVKELLRRPNVSIYSFIKMVSLENIDDKQLLSIQADIKYEGFVEKQKREIEKHQRVEKTKIPVTIDYDCISGLLTDSKNKLKRIKPLTIGQASRISGITPADISVLINYIIRGKW